MVVFGALVLIWSFLLSDMFFYLRNCSKAWRFCMSCVINIFHLWLDFPFL